MSAIKVAVLFLFQSVAYSNMFEGSTHTNFVKLNIIDSFCLLYKVS